jgi:hypothetical protein
VEDEHYIECVFDDITGLPINPGLNLQVASIKPSGSNSSEIFEVLGPLADIDHGVRVNVEAGYRLATSIVIIHRQFPSHAGLHTLSLLPEYPQQTSWTNNSSSTTPGTPPSHSLSSPLSSRDGGESYTPQISGMRCFICISREGYLYDVDSQHPRLLTTYTFSGETLASAVSSCFLYTLSNNALEVWTLRTCQSAGEEFPSPCLIGMQSLLFPYKICVANENVIMLSKFDSNSKPHSMVRPPALKGVTSKVFLLWSFFSQISTITPLLAFLPL